MKNALLLAALLPLGLAACASPREQCLNRVTREYRTVTNLLAEVEANLQRGYAWEEYEIERTHWVRCDRIVQDENGNSVIEPDMCLDDYTDTIRRRVVIDPVPETRKRDNLRAKQAELQKKAQADIAACKIAYPEEES